MTNWTGVWTKLDRGMDKIGLGYRQFWVGVWTKLSYPMYRFLYICNRSIINSGFDVILCLFYYSFGFIMKCFDFKDIKWL